MRKVTVVLCFFLALSVVSDFVWANGERKEHR